MDFKEIYNVALEMYPSQIDISDGKLFENDGFISASFTEVFERAEYDASLKGEWYSLVVWVIYQTLHEKAQKSFGQRNFTITRDVDQKLFREFLIHNLNQQDYEDMRQEFLDYERKYGLFA